MLDITKPKKLIKKDNGTKMNKKIITGAVIATTATAAGTAIATSNRGRKVINDIVSKDETKNDKPSMLTTWLRDAHAMEDAQIRMLKGVIKDFKKDKEIVDKLNKHLKLTEKQKKDVEKCLTGLGEKPGKSKELMGRFIGMGQAIDTKIFKDTKVKNMLMLHSGEHFEHISYMALAEAAKLEGKKSIATTMERIAREEREMADWVEKTLGGVVKQAL